jgi:hypothetical protein
MFHKLEEATLVTSSYSEATETTVHSHDNIIIHSLITYKKPIQNLTSASSPPCKHVFLHLSILKLHWVRVHSAFYQHVIIFHLRIVWEIFF